MDPRKLMGFESPSDERVTIRVGDWQALKQAMWRSKVAWEIAARAAKEILERCHHAPECPGATAEPEPCRHDCPDREQRMSALVVLNASRTLAPVNARRPANDPYFAPSREYFGEVLAELASAQAELEALRPRVDTRSALPSAELPALPEVTS